jgi:guanylate kinase
MTGHLFIVSGASGSGKTTLVRDVLADPSLNAERSPKYSERARRESKDGIEDDTQHVDQIDATDFDVSYVLNDTFYGVRTAEIEEQLKRGKNSFIILSDFHVIKRLKEKFGDRCTTVFVSSAVDADSIQKTLTARHAHEFNPTDVQADRLATQFYRLQCAAELGRWPSVFECMAELLTDWKAFIPDGERANIRAEKIRSFHNRYTDQLTLFDHVVLNHTQGDPSDMARQMRNLINSAGNTPTRAAAGESVLFVVAAASGAGKGLLMETTARIIGPSRVGIVTKYAKRDAKPSDRRDGMQAIGKAGVFPAEVDLEWTFHDSGGNAGTAYGISTAEVWGHLNAGRSAMVISNMKVFDEFEKHFGDRVVFIYLHATRSEEEIRAYQLQQNHGDPEEAERRIQEIRVVHDDYMDNIARFEHVLLNTAYKEDLFDQMIGLVNFYEAGSVTRALSS